MSRHREIIMIFIVAPRCGPADDHALRSARASMDRHAFARSTQNWVIGMHSPMSSAQPPRIRIRRSVVFVSLERCRAP